MQFKNLQIILVTFMAFVLLLGCSKKEDLKISSKQEDFTVTLPANPTTGFKWSVLEFDKNLFELKNHQYFSSKVGMLGAGGTMLYTFKLKKQQQMKCPCKSLIKFKYSRPWEPENATIRSITVYID